MRVPSTNWPFRPGNYRYLAYWVLCLCLLPLLLPTHAVYAQVNPNDPTFCYTVADNGGSSDADVLIRIDRSTGTSTAVVGPTGTFNVEGMTFVPGGTTLFAVEGNQLGTLNLTTAAFTSIGSPLGTANGAAGLRSISDVDGLAYNLAQNLLYGVVPRSTSPDLLIRINPATGALVPFAPGVDYRVITVTGSPNNFNDIDDLAFDPVTGVLYAISDSGANGELVTINPTTGIATYIADFSVTDEVEGLSFFNDGDLYASSGIPNNINSNKLYRVDKTNGVLTELGSLITAGNSDFEAIGCLTAAAFLAVEKTTNGVDADLPTGPHIIVGNPVTWAYIIRNTGVVPIDTITLVDDMLPAGTISCPAFPQPNNGLNPGEALTCTASGIATAGQYTNTAIVTGTAYLPTNDTVTLTNTDPSHYLGVQPDLVIGKDDGGISTKPGNTLIYTLSYSNTGTIDATGVVITEQVPANTTFNPTSSTMGWVCTPNNNVGSTCRLTLGAVAAGQRGSVSFAVTLVSSFPAGVNLVTNTAAIADDGTHGVDANPTNNQSTDTTPVLAAPELEADKQAAWRDIGKIGGIDPGEVITYTIIVRNIGNQEVLNVPLIDTPDLNSTLVAGSVSFATGTGTITLGNTNGDTTIAAIIDRIVGGGEARITYRVIINNPLPNGVDRIINRALVSNTIPLSTTVPAVATPDLAIAKTDGGVSVNAGAVVVYTLTYSNSGNRNAAGVVIKEVVPEQTTFVAASSLPTVWSCPDGSVAGTVCTATIGGLVTGGSGAVTFAVRTNGTLPAGLAELSNLARINDDGLSGDDPTPLNNVATDTTPVNAVPDLRLSKDDGNATTRPGTSAVYTLTYTNDGTQDATGVTLTEIVPTHTRFSAADSTPGWLCTPTAAAGSTCSLSIGNLVAGASGAVRFGVLVDNAVPAGLVELVNQAQVSDDGRNGADPTPQNNSDSDNTPLLAAPDLAIGKDDSGITVQPGGLVSYRLDYNNVGNQDATGVVITEVVPAQTTFAPASSTAGWLCSPNNNLGSRCTFTIGAVAVNQSGSINFAVTVVQLAPAGLDAVSNTAQIADDGLNGADPNLENNLATDTTPVDAAPNLIVEKTADLARARSGDTIKYTLAYTNVGNQGATGVVLREFLPEWTTFESADSTPGWSCAADPATSRIICTLAVGALGAGQAGTPVIFAVKVVAAIPDTVTELLNVVVVGDDGTNGVPPGGQHTDEVETPLIPPTSLPPSTEPLPSGDSTLRTIFLPLVAR